MRDRYKETVNFWREREDLAERRKIQSVGREIEVPLVIRWRKDQREKVVEMKLSLITVLKNQCGTDIKRQRILERKRRSSREKEGAICWEID